MRAHCRQRHFERIRIKECSCNYQPRERNGNSHLRLILWLAFKPLLQLIWYWHIDLKVKVPWFHTKMSLKHTKFIIRLALSKNTCFGRTSMSMIFRYVGKFSATQLYIWAQCASILPQRKIILFKNLSPLSRCILHHGREWVAVSSLNLKGYSKD